ncbi:MAG TPA: hypothetical protein ENH82_03585, partial [bacterium]|nr:hypothetical protein [bacterium]
MRILLLSNDTDIINTVQKYSLNSGDHLETASDIKQGKRILGSAVFDAVLMDCSIRAAELIGFASDNNKKLFETVVLLIGPLDTEQREQLGQRL